MGLGHGAWCVVGIQNDLSKIQIGLWISLALKIKPQSSGLAQAPRVFLPLRTPVSATTILDYLQAPQWSMLSSSVARSLHVLSLLKVLLVYVPPSLSHRHLTPSSLSVLSWRRTCGESSLTCPFPSE